VIELPSVPQGWDSAGLPWQPGAASYVRGSLSYPRRLSYEQYAGYPANDDAGMPTALGRHTNVARVRLFLQLAGIQPASSLGHLRVRWPGPTKQLGGVPMWGTFSITGSERELLSLPGNLKGASVPPAMAPGPEAG
jgi:hypothetical protein